MFEDIDKEIEKSENIRKRVKKLYPDGCIDIDCDDCILKFDGNGNQTIMCEIFIKWM